MRNCLVTGLLCGWIVLGAASNGLDRQVAAADFMIGIKAATATPDDFQRNAAEGQGGLVVVEVLDKSPASIAGIQPGDLLIGLGRQPLVTVQSLHDAVENSKGQSLELEIVREGRVKHVRLNPIPRNDFELLAGQVQRLTKEFEGGGGLQGLFKNFSPADLLNLGDLDVEVRRRGQSDPRSNAELERQLDRSRDPIAIYGRINVGQLLGSLWSGGSADPTDTERLQRRVEQLEAQIEQLKARLDELVVPEPKPRGKKNKRPAPGGPAAG